MPITTPLEPWKVVSLDFITGLPPAQGYNVIPVVVDHAGKYIYIIPAMQETSLAGLTKIYRDNVWKLHSLL